MKQDSRPNHCRAGMTRPEVMIFLAMVAAVAVLFLSVSTRPRMRSNQLGCRQNMNQLGLAFRQWAMDVGDRFPMELTMAEGGTKDHPLAHEAWVHLWVLSNEVSYPSVLACPTDPERVEANDFSTPGTLKNVSYFVSLDAGQDKPRMLLVGDRNLTADGKAFAPGIHTVNPGAVHGWTGAIHSQHGFMCFADGSAQGFSSAELQQYLSDNPQTNRLAVP